MQAPAAAVRCGGHCACVPRFEPRGRRHGFSSHMGVCSAVTISQRWTFLLCTHVVLTDQVWTRAPLATFALGFLAVWPVTTLGDALKRAWGTDLSRYSVWGVTCAPLTRPPHPLFCSVVCICTINLIASLWSNQAGRWLGMLLLQDMMDARIDPG